MLGHFTYLYIFIFPHNALGKGYESTLPPAMNSIARQIMWSRPWVTTILREGKLNLNLYK